MAGNDNIGTNKARFSALSNGEKGASIVCVAGLLVLTFASDNRIDEARKNQLVRRTEDTSLSNQHANEGA